MAMTPVKHARILRCNQCDHRAVAPRWRWPRCKAGGRDLAGEPVVDLDDAYMEGPDENCPKAYWAGLEPVPIPEAEPPPTPDEMAKRYAAQFAPWTDRLTNQQKEEGLVEMVERGKLPMEMAEALAKLWNLELDGRR